MVSLEENNHNRTWWYEQINLTDDWNSMPLEERKILLKKLQGALIDLTTLNISEQEMSSLLRDYDQGLVWDAILALADLSDKESRSHWQLLAYIKGVARSMWKAQHPTRSITWQQPEKVTKKKKNDVPADRECIERNNPINWSKRYCTKCGNKILVTNKTGICAKCQRRGNGQDYSEH